MKIGPIDDNGRKKLATLIERTRQWYQRRQEWELMQPLAEEVDCKIQELTQRSVALKINSRGIGRNVELWEQVEVFCAKEAEQGDRAAKYWHHTTAKQQAEASLILLTAEWSRFASNNPLSEAWRNSPDSRQSAREYLR